VAREGASPPAASHAVGEPEEDQGENDERRGQ
jgi:hypothetical protein